jgi:hypothetical protein
MGRLRQQQPARSTGLSSAAFALLAAIAIPIAYGIILNWRMFAADDWDRSSLTKIALCVVVASAIAAAALALPRGRDAGDSPEALGLLVGAALSAAITLTIIAVTPGSLRPQSATSYPPIRCSPSGVANISPIRSRGLWRPLDLR